MHDLIIIQIFARDRLVLRSDLHLGLFVHTAVDRIQQALCQVGAGTEELHFLSGLRCGYTAADRIVIAPYRTHDIIVFILNGACRNGYLRRILLKRLRQTG